MNTPEERLKRRLVSMPPVPPVPGLWPRLELARRQHVRRMKLSLGSAAAVLLGVALVPMLGDMLDRPSRTSLAASEPVPAAALPPALDQDILDKDTLEKVRALDRALQAAYDEGASDDEIEPLWEARRALLPRHASIPEPTTNGSTRS